MFFSQNEYNIRCEWGEQGISALAAHCDAIIVVDVFSFSTAVSVAVSRDALVYPYRYKDDSAQAFAAENNAVLAGKRSKTSISLSPSSLFQLKSGQRIVLPSPNGATISGMAGDVPLLAACLRNARAVAMAALEYGENIAVIPCGERWNDNSLRPALEDFIGAGAVISYLSGTYSPEAQGAVSVFQAVSSDLLNTLKGCSSGKELIEKGFEEDVLYTASLNSDNNAPVLENGVFVNRK